jgi:single-strand DNA-binding protein
VINKQIVVGRVGQEPKVVAFENGDRIANVSLATSRKWTNKKTGEKQEKTQWHNLVFRGGLVDIVESYVKKGDLLYCEGETESRKYQKDGADAWTTEVSVKEMQMLGSKGSNSESPKQEQSSAGSIDLPEDDIPF